MAILLFIEMGNKLFKNAKSYCKKSRDVIDGISTSNVLFIYISILSNVDIVVDEFHDFLSVVA